MHVLRCIYIYIYKHAYDYLFASLDFPDTLHFSIHVCDVHFMASAHTYTYTHAYIYIVHVASHHYAERKSDGAT